jgi:hypothetical protein
MRELVPDATRTPSLYYKCATTKDGSSKVYKYTHQKCGTTDNKYIYEVGTIYSCASTTSASDKIYNDRVESASSTCYNVKWNYIKGTCDVNSDDCLMQQTTFYYWYKLVGTEERTYYPSNSKTASGEKVYYTEAPIEGAIKDTETKATAYKWYKASVKTTTEYTATPPTVDSKKTNDYKVGSWSEWTTTNPKVNDGRTREIETKTKIKYQQILSKGEAKWVNVGNNNEYLTLENMIKLLKNNKYEVNTLEDISNNGTIRYQLKMYVRNKKETK